MELYISDHAIIQFLKRTKPDLFTDIKKQIISVVENGTEVKRKDNTVSLMNNGYREAKYYMKKEIIVVVENGNVKTSFMCNNKNTKNKWRHVL